MKKITRTIWLLSIVSLFTDMASEMLYPIMPVFLKSIGFSIVFIGILEGFAEGIAGISKAWFGNMSDQMGRRLPFVRLGYALSAVSKPMLALFVYPLWIFAARTIDRLGKGVRNAARDAMLSDESTLSTKAQVFGFHRSMDTIGAILGPALALVWLYYHPNDYRNLFLIAFIPSILAIITTFLLKEKNGATRTKEHKQKPVNFFVFFKYWQQGTPEYKKIVTGLLLFTLCNSSDVFLLLKAKTTGLSDTVVITLYIFYNLIYAILAYPVGILADKMGIKKILVLGLLLFTLTYIGFSIAVLWWQYAVLFLLYGAYMAATDGISKAWISNITPSREQATALGTFAGFQSLATLIASSAAGLLWFYFGPAAALLITAFVALSATIYIHIHCKMS